MSAYVTKPISTCERVSRALSALLSELHFPTRALGPITEARDLLLRAALDANEFYSTERDELTRDVVKLRADLAAAVAERDRIKGDHDEAAHFARHFIRDDPGITPRGAIIRLGDKCTELFVRLQQVEARLAAIDAAPTYALTFRHPHSPEEPGQLIAKPAKD